MSVSSCPLTSVWPLFLMCPIIITPVLFYYFSISRFGHLQVVCVPVSTWNLANVIDRQFLCQCQDPCWALSDLCHKNTDIQIQICSCIVLKFQDSLVFINWTHTGGSNIHLKRYRSTCCICKTSIAFKNILIFVYFGSLFESYQISL